MGVHGGGGDGVAGGWVSDGGRQEVGDFGGGCALFGARGGGDCVELRLGEKRVARVCEEVP